MCIKELQIGDLVQTGHNQFYQVEQIRIEYNEYRIFLKDTSVFATEKEIEPIPLTSEILEKNFPTPDEIRWMPENDSENCFVFKWEEPIGLGYNFALCVRYVHELQHLLMIVGVKKEIIL